MEAIGECPSCKSPRYVRLNCDGCELIRLNEAMQSPAGALLSRAADLNQMLQMPGLAVSLGQIDWEEWQALQIWRSEIDKQNQRKNA